MAELTEEDKNTCIEAFNICDLNSSGTLTFDEIVLVVRGLGWEEDMASEEDIKKWFTNLSINSEAGINQDQFLQAYGQSYLKDRRLAHLKKVFKDLDADKSGCLSSDELYSGFVKAGLPFSKKDVESLLKDMGSEKGQFNVKDFVNFFRLFACFSENM